MLVKYKNNKDKTLKNQLTILFCSSLIVTLFVGTVINDDAMPEEPKSIAKDSPSNEVKHNNDSVTEQANLKIPGLEKTLTGFEFSKEMKLRLQSVSEVYQESIKYPSFSLPIDPKDLDSKYLPDIPIANETPARLKDNNSPTLSVKTNQFRYQEGDQITAIASISGLAAEKSSTVSSRLLVDGEVIAYAAVTPVEGSSHQYQLDFNELHIADVEWKKQITVDTVFMFDGSSYNRGSTIEYVSTIASIEEISPSEVDGEYLTIPVYVSTEKPGFHRVKANLYDVQTGTPLLHLRAEGALDSNLETLMLKAHISALKASGSEGPYELKDLSLQRLPSKPDYITEFGRVEQESYAIDGYSFEAYLDKPYINEKSQRIAKELRRLGT